MAPVVANVGRSVESKRRAGRSRALGQPVERTHLATCVCESVVKRVRDDDFCRSLPVSGTPERRRSSRRLPAEELEREREAVFKHYENCCILTLDLTLLYLTAERAAGRSDGDYTWSRMTLCRSMQDLGCTFSRRPNHHHVATKKTSITAEPNEFCGISRSIGTLGKQSTTWTRPGLIRVWR